MNVSVLFPLIKKACREMPPWLFTILSQTGKAYYRGRSSSGGWGVVVILWLILLSPLIVVAGGFVVAPYLHDRGVQAEYMKDIRVEDGAKLVLARMTWVPGAYPNCTYWYQGQGCPDFGRLESDYCFNSHQWKED